MKLTHRAERESSGLGNLRFHRFDLPVCCTGALCAGSLKSLQEACQL